MATPFVILPNHTLPGYRPAPPPASNPDQPLDWFRIIEGEPPLVFLPRGSQVFALDQDSVSALAGGDAEMLAELRALSETAPRPALPESSLPAWSALSLNIAQSCNLTCDYCYADEGRFLGQSRLMDASIAVATVARFFESAPPGRVTIGFIGGEPFLNRKVMQAVVDYAITAAPGFGIKPGFSVTTNGSLLTSCDIGFLREHSFVVTVSLDGSEQTNDAHRRGKSGGGSFSKIRKALEPLLADPGGCRIAVRATITRDNLNVLERLDHFEAMGFTEAGVSPLRTSPLPHLPLKQNDWPVFLSEMCRAAERERQRIRSGLPVRFSNLYSALKQIHRGHYATLPCGAGANYLSANSEGEFFTCHRTIDDSRFHLGGLTSGPSASARTQFLAERNVDRQEPCRRCWARYLCGGGCHAEVINSGRHGCDFIRGWLEYCLRFHHWVLTHAPCVLSEPM